MKILFASDRVDSPSFQFYSDSLGKINDNFEDTEIEIKTDYHAIEYSKYDVALFMGPNQKSKEAKARNPYIIIGIVEPRAASKIDFSVVDFIIVNSIESKDFFSRYTPNIMIYYTYPAVPSQEKCPIKKNRLILGYHGNLLHLDAMYPRITKAIEKLSEETPVELWAMYNIERLGKWRKPDRVDMGFPVIHIQHNDHNYAQYMAHVDIGLVPQLIPVRESKILRYLIGTCNHNYNERTDNYFLRFKETTNIGRHLVFAQYGVPVVSDMTPSTCAFIDDGYDGFVAYHTEGWFRALQKLALNESLRIEMGMNLKRKYTKTATHKILNEKLIQFLSHLIEYRSKKSNYDKIR